MYMYMYIVYTPSQFSRLFIQVSCDLPSFSGLGFPHSREVTGLHRWVAVWPFYIMLKLLGVVSRTKYCIAPGGGWWVGQGARRI